jgi:hypothetical protein
MRDIFCKNETSCKSCSGRKECAQGFFQNPTKPSFGQKNLATIVTRTTWLVKTGFPAMMAPSTETWFFYQGDPFMSAFIAVRTGLTFDPELKYRVRTFGLWVYEAPDQAEAEFRAEKILFADARKSMTRSSGCKKEHDPQHR